MENPRLEVLGQKFNITGNLTNTANHAEISTTYNTNYSPILSVTGNVILEDKEVNRVAIKVVDKVGNPIILGAVAEKEQNNNALAYYTMRLFYIGITYL